MVSTRKAVPRPPSWRVARRHGQTKMAHRSRQDLATEVQSRYREAQARPYLPPNPLLDHMDDRPTPERVEREFKEELAKEFSESDE